MSNVTKWSVFQNPVTYVHNTCMKLAACICSIEHSSKLPCKKFKMQHPWKFVPQKFHNILLLLYLYKYCLSKCKGYFCSILHSLLYSDIRVSTYVRSYVARSDLKAKSSS